MLQGGALLPDVTVREMVGMIAALHRSPMPVQRAMEMAGITDIAEPEDAPSSPAGQAQRVRYALALVPDPDLLVLDEPTVAMDVEVRRAFWASMREFTDAGRTVLFATHYLDEADAFADRVVVLADGVMVADGTGAQIKATRGGPDDLGRRARCRRRAARCTCPACSAPSGRPRAILLHCNDSDTRAARPAGRAPGRRTTSRSPPAISRTPSCNSTATAREEAHR